MMGKKIKPLIYIFCEGESEIEYGKCLKERFSDVAVIMKPVKGLFSEAERKFKKEARYRNKIEVTDEIWFFFDVDHDQAGSWKTNQKIMQTLQRLRQHCPAYVKGDSAATAEIAGHMDTAVQNGAWILRTVDGIPTLEDNDVRSQWLYQCGKTFTTVQEAIEFLENL